MSRVRPKAMTVAVVLACLIRIVVGHEAGSDLMQCIAVPMCGGTVMAPILSMSVIPAVWFLLQRRRVSQRYRPQFDQAVLAFRHTSPFNPN